MTGQLANQESMKGQVNKAVQGSACQMTLYKYKNVEYKNEGDQNGDDRNGDDRNA